MAGSLSYILWTRRTAMAVYTLHDMGHPVYDPESRELIPHNLVKYEDNEDQLKDRPISIFVHPLLRAYGTNDGKNYDQGRVWAPAEVWFDSSISVEA